MGAELGERALRSEKSRLDLIQDKVIIGTITRKEKQMVLILMVVCLGMDMGCGWGIFI